MSDDTSAKVRMALESVVNNGSGRNAYIEGYRVGGKTGTAQKVKDGHYMVGNYITSFIGFLPANDPEVVVYVAVDNAKGITQYGGTVAAPIAKAVLTDAIRILDIKRPGGDSEKKYNYNDKKYVVVPDVSNLEKMKATKELKDFKVEFTGSGDKVLHQSPKGGTKLFEGDTVRLYLTSD